MFFKIRKRYRKMFPGFTCLCFAQTSEHVDTFLQTHTTLKGGCGLTADCLWFLKCTVYRSVVQCRVCPLRSLKFLVVNEVDMTEGFNFSLWLLTQYVGRIRTVGWVKGMATIISSKLSSVVCKLIIKLI